VALTDRQQLFVAEYLKDLCAAAAARRAGYSACTAEQIGYQLLQKTSVRQAIQEGIVARASRLEVQADAVLRELMFVAFSDIGKVLDFSADDVPLRPGLRAKARRAIKSLRRKRRRGGAGDPWQVEELEVVLWDKVQALDRLGRHLGLWQERPALEALLDGLDPCVAGPLREALARLLTGGGGEAAAAPAGVTAAAVVMD
jgi:phage terminase small subunit